jgi:hypothetical protein
LLSRLSLILRHAQDGASNLLADLEPYLSPNELTALQSRADLILKKRIFPSQPRDRRVIPWPPL